MSVVFFVMIWVVATLLTIRFSWWGAQRHIPSAARPGFLDMTIFTMTGLTFGLVTVFVLVILTAGFLGGAMMGEGVLGVAGRMFRDTALIALVVVGIASVLGGMAGIYIAEYAPPALSGVLRRLFLILKAIPAMFFGVFALVVVLPTLQTCAQAFPADRMPRVMFDLWWQDGGAAFACLSVSIGLMLGIFVASRVDRALGDCPRRIRDVALGLGLRRSEQIWHILLPAVRRPLVLTLAAVINRALGETTIVLFVFAGIGSAPNMLPVTAQIHVALNEGGAPLASGFFFALMLLLVTFGINRLAFAWTPQIRRRRA